MKTIWVLENIRGHRSFYNKFDLLMMISSVIQWKKHHPTFHTHVYLDKMSLELFQELNILKLWDTNEILPINKFIDKNVFWASSKLEALRFTKEPIIIMDNDFVVYKSFESFLGNKLIATHIENGEDYYIKPLDPIIRKVKHIINRPQLVALNCSFLYLPDYKVTQNYTTTSLELMTELTKLKAPNSKYLLYAEQLLLHHLLTIHKIPFETLLDKEYHCLTNTYNQKRQGFIETEKQNLFFRHYWMDKPKIQENRDGFNLKNETEQLENLVKNHILTDWSILNA